MSGSAVKCHTRNFLHKLKRDGTGKMIFLNLLTIRCTLARLLTACREWAGALQFYIQ